MGFSTPKFVFILSISAAIGLSACDSGNGTGADMADAPAAQVVTVSKPWIRATAPGQKVSGAFLTLSNSSAQPIALVSVEFDGATIVEIHETSMNGKMMKMQQVQQVEIPANGSVALKPGRYHIMLMGLGKSLQAGTTEPLTLTFSDHSQKTIEATVGDSTP